jgi:hypothetical protein
VNVKFGLPSKENIRKWRVCQGNTEPKKEEVISGWKNLHNEVLSIFHSSNTRVIKSRHMIWADHVACKGT